MDALVDAARRRPQDGQRRARPRARRAGLRRSIGTCCASRTASASPRRTTRRWSSSSWCAALPRRPVDASRPTRSSCTAGASASRKPLCDRCASATRATSPAGAPARTAAAGAAPGASHRPRAQAHGARGPRPHRGDDRATGSAGSWPRRSTRFRGASATHLENIADRRRGRAVAPTCSREMEIEPPDTLFGLYQGTPLTERPWDYGNTLPDRITLFQGPIEDACETEDDVVADDRRDADPRGRALLRPERRGDRGDRGAVLAAPDCRDGDDARRERRA